MRKVFASIYLLYSAIIFVSFMFIVLPFVLLASALLKPDTGKKTILYFLRFWAFGFSTLSFFWIRTRHKNVVNTNIPHIYVGNHGSYLDAITVCATIPQHFSPLG